MRTTAGYASFVSCENNVICVHRSWDGLAGMAGVGWSVSGPPVLLEEDAEVACKAVPEVVSQEQAVG
jgi:hypothetical protein